MYIRVDNCAIPSLAMICQMIDDEAVGAVDIDVSD